MDRGVAQLIPLIVTLPLLVFWLAMFWDMIKNDGLSNNARLYWVVGFVFLGIITAGYYYFTEYRKRQ